MKRFLKRAAVLALCLTMILGLTSCGSLSNLIKSGFDASGYVEGILDCTYKGEYEEYRKLTNATEEEAQSAYDNGIDVEVQTFMDWCSIDADLASDEFVEDLKDFYKRVYQKSKYEVKDAVKSDNGYYVEVIIEPIDIFTLAMDDMKAFADDFVTRAENGEFEDYTEEEYEAEYDNGLLDVCKSYESKMGYLESVSIVVTVAANEDGVYNVSNEDFARLDAKIIQYP